ncbi:YggT family protein [Massilia antarctica]|uniref:YggT family protein n=1 Tax=Massilia antarctica TaxID=2765360 RepID=UPI0006BDB2A0|nr:YggT family protein [Massilia antarctica]MCY0913545.1 YggT family protein [Massilia sp. H27-R4]CUI09693.1 Integral membrane protein YggT, involved in response to extracytoplasmic stress (osmotic shock) [Janthinobacterium sp. CG23_2]CUU33479.1 Integral membrane protein YggT, involved in response to extracytoplasmic stress (osmotic shock) [Janthinobacterium sp. CG23_2]
MLSIVYLIVDTVATILGGALLLRFWMQAIRVRPPASVAQFTFTLTDWLVKPMRRMVPGVGGYDWASLIGALLVVGLATTLYFLIGFTGEMVAVKVLYRFITWMIYGLMALLILEGVFSWVNPHAPLAPFVRALNEPLLRHLRRVVPPLGGVDFSMLVLLILLQIILMLVREIFPPYVLA